MINLLINCPEGHQKIIKIDETGEYFDQDLVLWDERVDGDLPQNITLGKMQRDGKSLITLDDYLPDHAAWMASQQIIIDELAKKTQLEEETKGDGDLALLRKMSGEEINAWFDLNVTNTNQCIRMLKKVVKSLVRKELL